MINIRGGTSPEVQWLRHRLPMQGAWVPSLVGDLRSHMPCGVATKNKNYGKLSPGYIITLCTVFTIFFCKPKIILELEKY